MASIFKAVDQLNGHTVAIKIPYAQFESDVVFYGRFQREEEVVRRLDHPNIIKVFTPERKSRMYIAMEYVEGVSLRGLMRDKRPLETEKALDLARQICAAAARRSRAPDRAAMSTIRRPPAGRPGTTVKPVGRRSSGCGNSSPEQAPSVRRAQ